MVDSVEGGGRGTGEEKVGDGGEGRKRGFEARAMRMEEIDGPSLVVFLTFDDDVARRSEILGKQKPKFSFPRLELRSAPPHLSSADSPQRPGHVL